MTCGECGKALEVGDWPFCNGAGTHGSVLPERAQRFEPIVLHQGPDGSYRFPGHTDDPVPEGYRKVEITTLREADRVTREINERERAEAMEYRERSRLHFDARRAEARRHLREELRRRGLSGRLAEAAMEYKDRQRAERERGNFDPGFHFEVFAFDASNRDSYRDARTEWRGRKG